MALKNPQNQPSPPAPLPHMFAEDLGKRCFPHKFRLIGSPYDYLNAIGIVPILEFIYKGNLLIDAARETNVPFTNLRRWIEGEGHFEAVEEAETTSAEGWLSKGQAMVLAAPTEFELRRAKEVVRHAQFMATKKNKRVYGEQVEKKKTAAVHYTFNISGPEQAQQIIPAVIEADSQRIERENAPTPQVAVDLKALYRPDSVPRLVAPRPTKPTYNNPDIGPFYEDPSDQENTRMPEYAP